MSIVNTLTLESNRQIKINFDGGDLSSDACLLLIKEFVSKLSINRLLNRSFKTNDSAVFRYHTDKDNLLQMIYMLIAGYFEDDASDERKRLTTKKMKGSMVGLLLTTSYKIIMDKIAVLVPCYNEEKTIGKVIQDWKKAIPSATIYVYNNNSTDNTAEIARSNGAIVRDEHQQGKGNVIRRMFREIDAECYIMIDGDDTYPAEFGEKMAEEVLKNNADMVVGDRLSSTYFEENKRPFHNLGNSIVRSSINHLFNTNIRDIMTGYRAFSYLFVKSFPALSKGFEIETEMTIHAVHKNMAISNVIIEYRDRPEGSVSKLNTYTDGLKVLRTIFRLYKNYQPLGFFSMFSVVLLLFAASLFIPILVKFMHIGLVPNLPTMIVSGFIALTAIISFFSGLILSTLVEKERQEYEFRLQEIHQWKLNKKAE